MPDFEQDWATRLMLQLFKEYRYIGLTFVNICTKSWNRPLFVWPCVAYVRTLRTRRPRERSSWWRHQMETFSALLAICAENPLVTGEFPTQRPVTQSCDMFFDLRPKERLSKQSWGWWFETPLRPLWRHSNRSPNFLVGKPIQTVVCEMKLLIGTLMSTAACANRLQLGHGWASLDIYDELSIVGGFTWYIFLLQKLGEM